MTELYEKSINTLELPKVLQLLSDCACSEEAKAACLALRPLESRWEVGRALEETSAAVSLLVTRSSPSFSGLRNVVPYAARADLGGSLSAKQLLEVAAFLSCTLRLQVYGSGTEDHSPLLPYFGALMPDKYLEDRITSAILSEDEIADNASSELLDIRRKMKIADRRVREDLQRIISSPSYAKILQEPIITSRSGRFVVPVRAEFKGSLPGLVHDVSSSGATIFVEPLSVVQSNNELRELEAKEQKEIERILADLSAQVAGSREAISRSFEMLVALDIIFARGKLSLRMDAREPALSDGLLVLKKARHPLLPPKTAVPVDITLGGDYSVLVITGPNTGGKTVSLKTAGLLALMTQCGLHIPASEESTVPVYDRVLADIGDEQSIAQSLSTFSSHMTVIVKILEECGKNTLVLFDELGGGTDPAEGAALAISIIERVRSRGACIMATTHYAELKSYAAVTEGVVNGSCEFDVDSLRPTYRLLIGVPGKSNAFAISKRLGLPEDIIADAASRMDSSAASVEEVVSALEASRLALEQDREEISASLAAARAKAEESERIRSELSTRLEKAEASARREAQHIIDDARRQSEKVFQELDTIRKLEKTEKDHQRVNDARAALRRELNRAEDALSEEETLPENAVSDRPVRAGDTVKLKTMGMKAEVISVAPDGTLSLQAGIMKVTASPEDVILLDVPKAAAPKKIASKGTALRGSAPSEVDLRGMMSDEALLVLDRFIDTASLARLQQVRIIHGKGTGALRAAVQQSLKKNRLVKSYRLGVYGEGETGVTIAELK